MVVLRWKLMEERFSCKRRRKGASVFALATPTFSESSCDLSILSCFRSFESLDDDGSSHSAEGQWVSSPAELGVEKAQRPHPGVSNLTATEEEPRRLSKLTSLTGRTEKQLRTTGLSAEYQADQVTPSSEQKQAELSPRSYGAELCAPKA
ncbi:transcriptional regulator [Striga asiatica]|uniref:Transcriptional regulator n=1 Tax=Striga asiatica TaxID=4170 RepID=A0A5A7Q7L8_STRAF|nr:transcriptional regulator [Striga asiatica]